MAGTVYENLKALGCQVNYLHGKTSIKTRLIDNRSHQQVVRLDQDVISDPLYFDVELPIKYDAIVISDYNKGTINYEMVRDLRNEVDVPIFIDTKKHLLHNFEGCIVKINSTEFNRLETTCTDLIVTHGGDGATYQSEVYPADRVEVRDVCGAGDSFLAALVYMYLLTNDMSRAIGFANKAAAVTVQHLGVYVPTLGEIYG